MSRQPARPLAHLRQRTAQLILFLFSLGLALEVAPPCSIANPLGTSTTYKREGWWDPARTWGASAIHMILARGASTHSQVLYWMQQDSTARAWRWDPGDTLIGGGADDIISIATGRSTNEMFCSGHSTLANGRAMISGGTEISPIGIYDVNTYNYATPGWVSPPSPGMSYVRWYPTSTILDDGSVLLSAGEMFKQMVLFGGSDSVGVRGELIPIGLRRPLAEGDTAASGSRPLAREGHTAIYDESVTSEMPSGFPNLQRMVVFGGNNPDSALGDTWGLYQYGHTNTWNWRRLWTAQDTFPEARTHHTAIYNPNDKTMVIFGGRRANGTALNDAWKLYLAAPDSGEWVRLAVGDSVPVARYGHTAIYDAPRQRMVVYGGTDGTSYYRDTWVLSMTGSPAWTRLNPSGTPPTARQGHSAVYWDNAQEMVIFGGGRTDSLFNQAWRLNLSDNTWRLIPPGTPPNPRTGHVAVVDPRWSRMVVFGGDTNGSTAGGKSAEVWEMRLDTFSTAFWTQRSTGWGTGPRSDLSAVFDPRMLIAVNPERFTPSGSSGSWETLRWAARKQPDYPFMFQLPSGKLFYAGPADSAFLLDLSDHTTPWESYDWSETDHHGGSAAMFLPGKVLKAGSHGGGVAQSSWIDLSGSPDTAQWRSGGDMVRPRAEPNLVIVPTGQVLVVGGVQDEDSGTGPAKRPQFWNPTKSAWSDSLAEEPVARGYHSTALLLPDARVLSAGGEAYPTDKYKATIFYPPYLFTSAGALAARPVIDEAPGNIAYGDTFSVCMVNTANVNKVCLIRPSAVTHAFDQNQRYIPLSFSIGTGANCKRLRVLEPLNAQIAPPGDYMLFVVRSDSVPSVAAWVRVGDSRDDVSPICLSCGGGGFGAEAYSGPDDSLAVEGSLFGQAAYASKVVERIRLSERAVHKDELRVRLRASGEADVLLSKVRAIGAEYGANEEVYAVGDKLIRGRREAASIVTLTGGQNIVNLLEDGPGHGFVADRPETVLVGLNSSANEHRIVLIEPSSGSGGNPMVLQTMSAAGAWEAAKVNDGMGAAPLVVEVPGDRLRLILDRGTGLRFVGELVDQSPVSGMEYSLRSVSKPGDGGTLVSAQTVPELLTPGEEYEFVFALSGRHNMTHFLEVEGTLHERTQPSAATDTPEAGPAWSFELRAPKPNPLQSLTTIQFSLAERSEAQLRIYAASGRLVRTLAKGQFAAGLHDIVWNGSNDAGIRVAPGVYFCRLEAAGRHQERKLVLLGH